MGLQDVTTTANGSKPVRTKAPPPRARHVPQSEGAYKTIAAVAEELGVATHVLRFWESKFPAIKPLKQQGGRRFYGPEDVLLLKHIRHLLYEKGLTIRGVQTTLAAQSPRQLKHQAALTPTMLLQELKTIRTLLGDGPA